MTQTAIQEHKGGVPAVYVGDRSLAEVVQNQLWKDPTALKGKANVLFPITALDDLPPMMRPSLTVVHVEPNPAAREVYDVGSGKLGLSKPVIMKMLNAAGASVSTRKLTPSSSIDVIEWQATVSGYTPDGQYHSQTATKTWIWEEVQKNCKEFEAKQQRKFANEICETKAILRAARAFLNIQTSYTAPELNLPFLIAKAVPDLDPNDPDVKKAMIAKATGATDALYPQPALPQGEPEGPVIDAEVVHKPQNSEPAASDEEYNPETEQADSLEEQRLAMEAKVAAMAKGSADGGIGKTIGRVLAKYGTKTWAGQSLDTLTAIYEDCVAVREGRLEI